jgi:hypothetical protein
MFGSVFRLVGVDVADEVEGVWVQDCKLEGKGRNRLSLTQPTTISLDMVQYLVRLLLMAARLGG